jgi:hypothetical protein
MILLFEKKDVKVVRLTLEGRQVEMQVSNLIAWLAELPEVSKK